MKILILCTRHLEVVILITLVASFLSWHASLFLKRNFYVTGNSSQSYCYSLGMVKTEAFDYSHFMHQAVRVDHTGSIDFSMACISDLKKKFLCNLKLIKIVLHCMSVHVGYSLGIVTLTNVRTYVRTYIHVYMYASMCVYMAISPKG